MSSNMEQRLDCLALTQKINRSLTSQHVEKITQHFGLPASITEAGNLWPEMRMRGKFNENNVWELREFLIKLNAEDPTNYLVEIINEISYYHNRYRAWQRNDSIANPIVALNHGEPAVPVLPMNLSPPRSLNFQRSASGEPSVSVAPVSLSLPRCLNFRRSASGERIQCDNRIPKFGTIHCDECGAESKTSHYNLPSPPVPVVAELKGMCGIPGPIGSPPPISLLGHLVGGSVGVPYYNHKRQIESPTEEKDKECGLCMTNEKYVATQPCGCVCLCGSCALTYSEKTCIGCTKPVTYLQGLRLG